ncbi:hypothetical protein ACFL5P_01585 [candidate division KSB1 bacterium]
MKYFKSSLIVIFSCITILGCSTSIDDPYLSALNANGIDVKIISETEFSVTQLFRIEEVLSVGGDTEDPVLFQPTQCFVDENDVLYFNDEDVIKKFSPDVEG